METVPICEGDGLNFLKLNITIKLEIINTIKFRSPISNDEPWLLNVNIENR